VIKSWKIHDFCSFSVVLNSLKIPSLKDILKKRKKILNDYLQIMYVQQLKIPINYFLRKELYCLLHIVGSGIKGLVA